MDKKVVVTNGIYSLVTGGVKLLAGFALLKLGVEVVGKENLVFLGQFNSVFLLATSVASAGVYSGIVSLNRKVPFQFLLNSVLLYVVLISIGGLIVFNLLWYFTLAFKFEFFSDVYMFAIVAFFSFPLHQVVLGVMNVRLPTVYLYFCRMLSSVLVLFLGYIVIFQMNEGGYLINTLTGFAVICVGCVITTFKKKELLKNLKRVSFKKSNYKIFIPFGKVFCASVFMMPLAKIFVRDFMLTYSNVELASHWQAFLTISDSYTLIFSIFLTGYYLKFLSNNMHLSMQYCLKQITLYIVPLLCFSFILVYFFWRYVLNYILGFTLAETGDFRGGFVAGDFFRFLLLLITYNFIVRQNVKAGILFEVMQSVFYVVFTLVGFYWYELKGAAFGYFGCYLLCFLVGVFYIYRVERDVQQVSKKTE